MSNTSVPTTTVGDITPHAIASVATLIRPYVLCTPVVFLDRSTFGLAPGPLVLKLDDALKPQSAKYLDTTRANPLPEIA